MDEKLKRVVYYIRVSTEEQKIHGLSLDAQRMKLDEYAQAHNFVYVGTYADEGISGRKPIKKRPQLQKMLQDAQKNMFDLIIFIKLDRYFRSVAEYHECQKILDKYGIQWTATEEKYDLTTANGRAFVNMRLTIAELEADTTGERLKIVNDYRVKNGYLLTGNVPFGFKTARENGRTVLKIDNDAAPIIYAFLDHFEEYHNLSKANEYILNEYGVDYPYSCWRRLLQNTFLYGSYRGNDKFCKPYISKERFERIQAILANNVRHTNFRTYMFSGLVYCKKSGKKMMGQYNNTNRPNETLSYRCYKNGCEKIHSISERKIEKCLVENFQDVLAEYISNTEMREKERKPIILNLKKLNSEKSRLNHMFQKGRISIEEYDTEYERIESQIKRSQQNSTEKKDLSRLRKLASGDFALIYETLDKEHKRTFWRTVIERIEIDDRRISFSLKDDFEL